MQSGSDVYFVSLTPWKNLSFIDALLLLCLFPFTNHQKHQLEDKNAAMLLGVCWKATGKIEGICQWKEKYLRQFRVKVGT